MQLSISEILSQANAARKIEDRIGILRSYTPQAHLKYLLRLTFDPGAVWLLPEGKIDYKPTDIPGKESNLLSETKRLYLFIEGEKPELQQQKREMLFIQMLEGLDPKDAELLCSCKDKKLPYKNIDSKLVLETWPGLY